MLRWVGGSAVALIVLCGCSGGSDGSMPTSSRPVEPVGTTSSSTPVSSSPSPTGPKTTGPGVRPGETAPVMPPLAKQHTPQGAMAFAGYYVHALDWSFATTDSYLLHGLSTSECTICTSHIAGIDDAESNGEHVEGGRAAVLEVKLLSGTSKVHADQFIQVKSRQSPGRVADAAGRTVETISGGTASNIFYVLWVSTRWQVTAIGDSP